MLTDFERSSSELETSASKLFRWPIYVINSVEKTRIILINYNALTLAAGIIITYISFIRSITQISTCFQLVLSICLFYKVACDWFISVLTSVPSFFNIVTKVRENRENDACVPNLLCTSPLILSTKFCGGDLGLNNLTFTTEVKKYNTYIPLHTCKIRLTLQPSFWAALNFILRLCRFSSSFSNL